MVVCEPLEEDETADCFDVGITSVSLPDILEKGANIVDANLPGDYLAANRTDIIRCSAQSFSPRITHILNTRIIADRFHMRY